MKAIASIATVCKDITGWWFGTFHIFQYFPFSSEVHHPNQPLSIHRLSIFKGFNHQPTRVNSQDLKMTIESLGTAGDSEWDLAVTRGPLGLNQEKATRIFQEIPRYPKYPGPNFLGYPGYPGLNLLNLDRFAAERGTNMSMKRPRIADSRQWPALRCMLRERGHVASWEDSNRAW